VQKADIAGCEILVVRVQPYPVPPVVEVNGVPWVRVGTSTQRATEADRVRLNERRPEGRQPFDIRPHRGSDLGALALRKLRERYDVARHSDEDDQTFPEFEKWLGQKNLARLVDGIWVPTTAAVLVYGVDPLTYLPGALVEFARYDGVDVDSTVTSRRTITGDLCDQLETIWAQLNANNSQVVAKEQGIRTPYPPEYPVEALRELARNQVQHRLYEGTNAPGRINWFKDRIEFYNPGGPYGQAKEGEFGDQADYRNPTITNLLVELGYVERLGRGIQRVRQLLEKNGNPPFEVRTDGYTVITIRSHT
jgi:ATP-dependent DNA helicase RecG